MGTREGKLTRAVVPCVAGCGGLHMSVVHPICRMHAANARRRRVSHSAPALRPHFADQILMRVRCAHNREIFFNLFGLPKSGRGVGPRRALQFCSSSWFDRPRRWCPRSRRPQRRRRSLPPPALDGCGLRRTASVACSSAEWRRSSRSHSALCRTPAMRMRVRVRTAGRWGRLRVRSHCCSRRQH
jgi:hypothetical protein